MSFEINSSMEENIHFIQLSGEGSTFEYRGNYPYSAKLIRNTTDNSILLDALLRPDTPIYIEDAAIENPNLNSDTIDKVIKQGLETKDYDANLVLSLSKHPKLSLGTMRYVVSRYDSDINYTVFLIRMCGNVNISTEILDDLAKISVNEGVLQAVLNNQKCSTETIRYLLSGEKGGISKNQINRVLTPWAIKNRNCPPNIVIGWMKDHNMIKKQDPNTHEIEYHETPIKPRDNSLEELKQLISINLNEKITIAQLRDKETQDLVDKFTEEYGQNPDDWDYISVDQKLSENFIREFQYKVNWYYISYKQKLSEDFIREFKDKVDWDYISVDQKLSENFIREFQDKVNWDNISSNLTLSEDFIREFQYKVNWDWISYRQTLSENFIREFKDKVHWRYISQKQTLSEDFIREFKDKVFWDYISQEQTLSEDFIREFKDKVNWRYISQKQTLSEDFIREFKDKVDMNLFCKYNPYCPPDIKIRYMKEHNIIKKQDPNTHEIEYHEIEPIKPRDNSLEELKQLISINLNEKITIAQVRDKETQDLVDKFTEEYGQNPDDWDYISVDQKLSEDFIREFRDKVQWDWISFKQKLSEDFIREFKDKVLWDNISFSQILSEDFIREFKDKVNWDYISQKQTLSENFIREFKDKVHWSRISYQQKLSEDFIKEFKDKVDWDYISQKQTLSEDFIREFKDKVNMRLFCKYNPYCPPDIKIRWMKENNIIKKQDPKTHEIEYFEEPIKPVNNSLEELKKLISINLNEKITIAQSRDKETQDLVDKFTKKYGTKNPDNWNWNSISFFYALPEDFIREFKDKVHWSQISYSQTLSEDFIREFKDKVCWTSISYHQRLSEDFINEFKDQIDWDYISQKQTLSENFINEFKDKVNWYYISQKQTLSENFINEFKDQIDWIVLCRDNPHCPPDIKIRWMKENNLIKKQDPKTHEIEYHEVPVAKENNSLEELKQLISINLNEKIVIAQVNNRDRETQELVNKFTEEYGLNPNQWNWNSISFSYALSENFIREFQYKVDWYRISYYQKLSENFIREFKDKVLWDYISFNQKLSEDFIREFKDKVNWAYISAYQKLSENFIREFKDKVNWDYISQKQTLSEDFIREFKDKVNMRLFCRYNPSCTPDIKIRYMKEHNIIKKQDPNTHEIEYHETPIKPTNNSLEELKKLIQ